MNESTRRILIVYALVAIIFYIIAIVPQISTGAILMNGIFFTIVVTAFSALVGVGYYQCLIVDYLGFTDLSRDTIVHSLERLGDAISRSINDGWVWFLVKLFVFALFGWAIGLIRAILRIKKSMDE